MTRLLFLLVGITTLAIGVGWLAGHPAWSFVTFGGMVILCVGISSSIRYVDGPAHGGVHPDKVPPKFRGGRLQV